MRRGLRRLSMSSHRRVIIFRSDQVNSHQEKSMETAAAILTKLAFEQNDELKSQLQAFGVETAERAQAIILPVYRVILAALERGTPGAKAQQSR
jgi:hypothetical protein